MPTRLLYSLTALASLTLLGSMQTAAQEVDFQDLAQAAGYKAMFTCAATFNGNKTPEQINAHELKNTYDVLEKTEGKLGEVVLSLIHISEPTRPY